MPQKFWGIVGQDPSDSKSNQLHVDIFRFCFNHLRHILQIPLKWSAILLNSPTSTGYFSNSTGSSVTNRRFSPSHVPNAPKYDCLLNTMPSLTFVCKSHKGSFSLVDYKKLFGHLMFKCEYSHNQYVPIVQDLRTLISGGLFGISHPFTLCKRGCHLFYIIG